MIVAHLLLNTSHKTVRLGEITLDNLQQTQTIMEFFWYENKREPPSLADQGFLRFVSKVDIYQFIETPKDRAAAAKPATVMLMDMAAVVVHLLTDVNTFKFSEYVQLQIYRFWSAKWNLLPHEFDRIWDSYLEKNFKNLTRQWRGTG